MGSFALTWIMGLSSACWPQAPCSAQPVAPQPTYVAQAPAVYYAPVPQPVQVQLTYQQIQNIGLDCNQRDYIVNYLERQVGTAVVAPEQLPPEQRKINSAARSKIWQLRTYCK